VCAAVRGVLPMTVIETVSASGTAETALAAMRDSAASSDSSSAMMALSSARAAIVESNRFSTSGRSASMDPSS
jgi:hypothetical protein